MPTNVVPLRSIVGLQWIEGLLWSCSRPAGELLLCITLSCKLLSPPSYFLTLLLIFHDGPLLCLSFICFTTSFLFFFCSFPSVSSYYWSSVSGMMGWMWEHKSPCNDSGISSEVLCNESSGCLGVKHLYLSRQCCDNRPKGPTASSLWRRNSCDCMRLFITSCRRLNSRFSAL